MSINNLVVMLIMQVLIKTGYEIVILPITYKVVHVVSKYENGKPVGKSKTLYTYDNKQIQN